MWVYMKAKEGDRYIYTVGFYYPHFYAAENLTVMKWNPVEDCGSEKRAQAMVNYLNGGTGEISAY